MPLSKHLKLQISSLLDRFTEEEKIILSALPIVAARISSLRNQNNFLETIFLNAVFIEVVIKVIINAYAYKRRILESIGEKDIYSDIQLDTEDKTLGSLIIILKKFNLSKVLIGYLNDFKHLRNQATHHLFDKDLKSFDDQARDYFVSNNCNNLYIELQNELDRVKKDIKNIIELAGLKK